MFILKTCKNEVRILWNLVLRHFHYSLSRHIYLFCNLVAAFRHFRNQSMAHLVLIFMLRIWWHLKRAYAYFVLAESLEGKAIRFSLSLASRAEQVQEKAIDYLIPASWVWVQKLFPQHSWTPTFNQISSWQIISSLTVLNSFKCLNWSEPLINFPKQTCKAINLNQDV